MRLSIILTTIDTIGHISFLSIVFYCAYCGKKMQVLVKSPLEVLLRFLHFGIFKNVMNAALFNDLP